MVFFLSVQYLLFVLNSLKEYHVFSEYSFNDLFMVYEYCSIIYAVNYAVIFSRPIYLSQARKSSDAL